MSFPTFPGRKMNRTDKPNLNAMQSLLSKLSEPSTVRGMVALAGSLGMLTNPDYSEHIVAAVLAVIGIINVWRKEPKIPKATVVEDEGGPQ
jgi:hypothetical protein